MKTDKIKRVIASILAIGTLSSFGALAVNAEAAAGSTASTSDTTFKLDNGDISTVGEYDFYQSSTLKYVGFYQGTAGEVAGLNTGMNDMVMTTDEADNYYYVLDKSHWAKAYNFRVNYHFALGIAFTAPKSATYKFTYQMLQTDETDSGGNDRYKLLIGKSFTSGTYYSHVDSAAKTQLLPMGYSGESMLTDTYECRLKAGETLYFLLNNPNNLGTGQLWLKAVEELTSWHFGDISTTGPTDYYDNDTVKYYGFYQGTGGTVEGLNVGMNDMLWNSATSRYYIFSNDNYANATDFKINYHFALGVGWTAPKDGTYRFTYQCGQTVVGEKPLERYTLIIGKSFTSGTATSHVNSASRVQQLPKMYDGEDMLTDVYVCDLKAGETLYFLLDQTNNNGLGRLWLRSVEEDANADVKAPTAATLTLDDATSGMADGKLTITLPENHYGDDIYMWWGDENGKLDGYTMLARFKVPSKFTTKFEHTMTPNTFIPSEATKLMIYTYSDVFGVSDNCCVVDLASGSGYVMPNEEPIAEFQVVSDIHICTALHEQHFKSMLQDIAKTSPNSAGIFAVGDVVDNGANQSYWNDLWRIYNSVDGVPHMYIGIGNHEKFGFTSYDDVLSTFLKNLKMPDGYEKPDTVYYDVWIDGFHYIFLGDTTMTDSSVHATIGDEQYDWLEAKLAEATDDRPVFIFMHQSMKNTVSGSSDEIGWWGITDDTRMREILDEYPNAFLFNGHTHCTLNDDDCMAGGGDEAAIFNTASVGYLMTYYDSTSGSGLEGSQGYYVYVYSDRVLVRGRDFTTGEWVSSAQFVVDGRNSPAKSADNVDTSRLSSLIEEVEKLDGDGYTEKSWSALTSALTAAKEALNADAQRKVDEAYAALNSAKSALVKKKSDTTKADGDTTNTTDTGVNTDTDTDTEASTDTAAEEKKGGCKSSLSGVGIALTSSLGAAFVLKKRKNGKDGKDNE